MRLDEEEVVVLVEVVVLRNSAESARFLAGAADRDGDSDGIRLVLVAAGADSATISSSTWTVKAVGGGSDSVRGLETE